MDHHIKTNYIWGFKDGLTYGIEKGMELAEYFNNSDCPPNTNSSMVLVEIMPTEEPAPME